MSEKILCGPCGYVENNKNAENWCTVCEEGLCADCEKVHISIKTSRNHRLISIEDYRQIKNISISLKCKDHDKQLELYCKSHDVAVCLGCVPSRHRTCSDVIPLDKAAENAKHSTALADLEKTLTRTLQNLQHIISDRESALEHFESQKQTIKNTINDTRARILQKIDDLEQKLFLEIDSTYHDFKSEENKIVNHLKNSEIQFTCLMKQTSQLKSFASNIQLFLGTRQINVEVYKQVESVKKATKSAKNCEIFLQLNPSIIALMNEVDQLGKISVQTITISLPFQEPKVDQAQIQLRAPNMKCIDNIRLQLINTLDLKQERFNCRLTGCTMLPNGNLLIADYYKKDTIMEYSEDGKHLRDIPCSGDPFDLTVMDSDRIAVTYGSCKYIEILSANNNTVDKRVEFLKGCYGISYLENKLFIVVNGITITDSSGNVLKTLMVNHGLYLEVTTDRIHFTHKKSHSVMCISMTGEDIWTHKDESLVALRGITVDGQQNVFVFDTESNALIVIQHDGRSSRTLLTKSDGIDEPCSLHFNKDKNVLILCNKRGCVALYSLK